MIPVAILKALVANGTTAEAIVAIIEIDQKEELEKRAAIREAARIRKQKQRSRHSDIAGQSVTSCDTPSPSLSPSPSPSSSPPITPLITTPTLIPFPTPIPKNPRFASNWPPNGFEEVWKIWPKKVSKRDAIRAVEKASTKVNFTDFLSAAQRYSKQVNPEFCAHLATWANGERWNDDLSLPPAPLNPRQQARENWKGLCNDLLFTPTTESGFSEAGSRDAMLLLPDHLGQ